jgi:hypothetical protein
MGTQLTVVITATVAVTGWFIAHLLTTLRDDRTRRLGLIIAHAEKQIEFYSPLIFLFEQLNKISEIKKNIENSSRADLGEVMYHNNFLPLHEEIISVLKDKSHLLEDTVIPQAIMDYIAHFTSENLAWRWTEINKEPNEQIWNFVIGYPGNLLDQLKRDRELARRRYEQAVHELRHGGFAMPALKNIAALFSPFADRLLPLLRRSPKADDELLPGPVANPL